MKITVDLNSRELKALQSIKDMLYTRNTSQAIRYAVISCAKSCTNEIRGCANAPK